MSRAPQLRQWAWFAAIWALSVVVVAGLAEALHWWIMTGSRP